MGKPERRLRQFVEQRTALKAIKDWTFDLRERQTHSTRAQVPVQLTQPLQRGQIDVINPGEIEQQLGDSSSTKERRFNRAFHRPRIGKKEIRIDP